VRAGHRIVQRVARGKERVQEHVEHAAAERRLATLAQLVAGTSRSISKAAGVTPSSVRTIRQASSCSNRWRNRLCTTVK